MRGENRRVGVTPPLCNPKSQGTLWCGTGPRYLMVWYWAKVPYGVVLGQGTL